MVDSHLEAGPLPGAVSRRFIRLAGGDGGAAGRFSWGHEKMSKTGGERLFKRAFRPRGEEGGTKGEMTITPQICKKSFDPTHAAWTIRSYVCDGGRRRVRIQDSQGGPRSCKGVGGRERRGRGRRHTAWEKQKLKPVLVVIRKSMEEGVITGLGRPDVRKLELEGTSLLE